MMVNSHTHTQTHTHKLNIEIFSITFTNYEMVIIIIIKFKIKNFLIHTINNNLCQFHVNVYCVGVCQIYLFFLILVLNYNLKYFFCKKFSHYNAHILLLYMYIWLMASFFTLLFLKIIIIMIDHLCLFFLYLLHK